MNLIKLDSSHKEIYLDFFLNKNVLWGNHVEPSYPQNALDAFTKRFINMKDQYSIYAIIKNNKIVFMISAYRWLDGKSFTIHDLFASAHNLSRVEFKNALIFGTTQLITEMLNENKKFVYYCMKISHIGKNQKNNKSDTNTLEKIIPLYKKFSFETVEIIKPNEMPSNKRHLSLIGNKPHPVTLCIRKGSLIEAL